MRRENNCFTVEEWLIDSVVHRLLCITSQLI